MSDRLLDCPDHGKGPWLGDVACADCGAVFLCVPVDGDFDYPAVPAEGKCTCGAQLMPSKTRSVPFTARAVCRSCAAERAEK